MTTKGEATTPAEAKPAVKNDADAKPSNQQRGRNRRGKRSCGGQPK